MLEKRNSGVVRIKLGLTLIVLFLTVSVFSQGVWTQKADFGGTARIYAVGFSINGKGYIGTGLDQSMNNTFDLWEYDTAGNSWTQKANMISPGRYHAFAFSIGSKGYIGTGWNASNRVKDFWEYDPVGNIWTQRADFGGGPREMARAFSIGTKGYVAGGEDSASYAANDFWEYDQGLNIWVQKTGFPLIARYWGGAFSIGGRGYLSTGMDTINPNPPYKKDLWEYDPVLNSWSQKADFTGFPRFGAIGFSIGLKGYLGTGYDSSGYVTSDFREYDTQSNTWTIRSNFGGTARHQAVAFSIGPKGYVGTGIDNNSTRKDFWEYNPSGSVNISQVSKQFEWIVYPNPTQGQLNIDHLSGVNEIELLDISGKSLSFWNTDRENLRVDLTEFPTGVYFLRISKDSFWEVKKLIIL